MADVDPIAREPGEEDVAAAPVSKRRGLLMPVLLVVAVLLVGAGAYFAGRLTAPHDDVGDESSADAGDESAADTKKGKVSAKAKNAAKGKDGKSKDGKSKDGKSKAEKRAPLFYAMEPAFVVNYQDLQALRFLQVGVQVMAFDQADLDALKANEPLARNALVMLFSGQTYDVLITREGKEKLREEALQELRKVIADHASKESLQAVYFTSFVMQ